MADCPCKTCFICKQSLLHEAFNKSKSHGGLYPYCRACDSIRRANRLKSDPAWADGQAEKKRAYDAVYNEKNKERIRLRMAADYRSKAERKKAQIREWQKANPELVRAYKATSKAARRAQTEIGITGPELYAWKKAQPKVCHWCGVKCAKKFHVDHYVPLSRGGTHEAKNLVIACQSCNLRKHAKDPLAFAREVGRLL